MTYINNIYLIKDLSRLSGHSVHTLKFYLNQQLLEEVGRSPQTRFRYFNDATLARLAQIRAWRKQRKSLAEIKHLLTRRSHGAEDEDKGNAIVSGGAPSGP